ncbi:MAG: helix-turn-helix transcriptional regulator [Proteobacteria bacterium]|nr:helix-turn-helix transcriptional regulator [Pseudomonadota bacterium]
MKLEEIGHEIRRSRLSLGLTQGELAAASNVTRTTLSQLENGVIKDLGIRKVEAILEQLGLTFLIDRTSGKKPPDFLRLASTAASVSFKTPISADELRRILLTGKVPADRRAQMRALLEESPKTLLNGLIQQMRRSTDPGKLERNLARILAALGLPDDSGQWLARPGG